MFVTLNNADLLNQNRETNKHYYNDEIIVFGTDEQGQQFLIKVDMQRKQKATADYSHYYLLESVINGKIASGTATAEDKEYSLKATGFLSKMEHLDAEDLSTREKFIYTVSIAGVDYIIDIPELSGDFIVRNKPNYIRYLSEGDAFVTFNGKQYKAHALMLKSYAEDFSQYIFFDGYYQLDSVTHFLAVWDAKGNFYLVDQSQVASVQDNYKAHTWVLSKDYLGNMQKSFTATIAHPQVDLPKDWTVSLPKINSTTLDLNVTYYFKERAAGLVTGTVADKNGTRTVGGYAIYAVY
jgi:hypothetical protein